MSSVNKGNLFREVPILDLIVELAKDRAGAHHFASEVCHFHSITSTSINIDILVASYPVRHSLLLPH